LLVAHVRTNHVHGVVQAKDERPERVMNDFKAYASRALNRSSLDAADCKRWTRHGSTVYLWTDDEVLTRVRYVASGQGEPMAVYVAPDDLIKAAASAPRDPPPVRAASVSERPAPLPDGRGSDRRLTLSGTIQEDNSAVSRAQRTCPIIPVRRRSPPQGPP
jgi:hypothetical protein